MFRHPHRSIAAYIWAEVGRIQRVIVLMGIRLAKLSSPAYAVTHFTYCLLGSLVLGHLSLLLGVFLSIAALERKRTASPLGLFRDSEALQRDVRRGGNVILLDVRGYRSRTYVV